MTTGLIRSEAGGDLRTLAAMGAAGRTRRTLTAATAARARATRGPARHRTCITLFAVYLNHLTYPSGPLHCTPVGTAPSLEPQGHPHSGRIDPAFASGLLLRLLDERFERQLLTHGPYFFSDLVDTTEADEQAAIDAAVTTVTTSSTSSGGKMPQDPF